MKTLEEKLGLVSIIMGIYNCADTLPRSIDSIVNQTYTNWELILCDDGSDDLTYAVASEYVKRYPNKIKLLRNEKNLGLNKTLNRCLEAAEGEFIARQDGDDVSLPTRLEREVAYLQEHTDCAFVSVNVYINDGTKRIGRRNNKIIRPRPINLAKSNCFWHAPCMIRRRAFVDVGGYTEDRRLLRVEDYNLWTKLFVKGYYGENIQENLYEVLEDASTYKRRKFRDRLNGAYATFIAIRDLKLPVYCYYYVLLTILKGLIPSFIYRFLHRKTVIN